MRGCTIYMSNRIKLVFCVVLAAALTVSCVHQVAESKEYVPVVDGSITIQSYDGHELLVYGQEIYLLPETRQVKDFFDMHNEDFYIDKEAIMSFPGAKSAVIDRYGKFSFSNIAPGNYYVFWQRPLEEKNGFQSHVSIDNKVVLVGISRSNNKVVFEDKP